MSRSIVNRVWASYGYRLSSFAEGEVADDLWGAIKDSPVLPGGNDEGGVSRRFTSEYRGECSGPSELMPFCPSPSNGVYEEKYVIRVTTEDPGDGPLKPETLSCAKVNLLSGSDMLMYEEPSDTFDRTDERTDYDVFGSDCFWFYAKQAAFERLQTLSATQFKSRELGRPNDAITPLFAVEVPPTKLIDWESSSVVWELRNAGYGLPELVSPRTLVRPAFYKEHYERGFYSDRLAGPGGAWLFANRELVAELQSLARIAPLSAHRYEPELLGR